MVLNRKEFAKLAVSMGIAKRSEVKMYMDEFPKDSYDDFKDIVGLSRMAELGRKWKQSKPGRKRNEDIRIVPLRGGVS